MNVLKNRTIYLWVSWAFFIISVLLLVIPKLNLGIDLTWWIQMTYDYKNSVDIEKIKEELENEKSLFKDNGEQIINSVSAYSITWEKTIAVVVWFHDKTTDVKLEELKKSFKSKVFEIVKKQDETAIEASYINIWKSFGDYIKNTAFITLTIALVAIAIYITFAFSWVISWISVFSFAIITLITLFFDIIVSSWAYIFTSMFLPEFQIDTFFITALLTILGYSLNDTIVIFDRIRSNLKTYAWKTWKNAKNLEEIVNLSVNEMLTRSIYTSLTIFFVLLTIFIFWPKTLSGFILVMLFGTIVGTYSSIFMASPILYVVNKNKKLSAYKKVIVDPNDKIVV